MSLRGAELRGIKPDFRIKQKDILYAHVKTFAKRYDELHRIKRLMILVFIAKIKSGK
jgi:hypothetical protein